MILKKFYNVIKLCFIDVNFFDIIFWFVWLVCNLEYDMEFEQKCLFFIDEVYFDDFFGFGCGFGYICLDWK